MESNAGGAVGIVVAVLFVIGMVLAVLYVMKRKNVILLTVIIILIILIIFISLDINDHYVLRPTICCPDHLNQLDCHPYDYLHHHYYHHHPHYHHPHGYQVKKPESPTVAFENPFYATREQAGNTAVRNNY